MKIILAPHEVLEIHFPKAVGHVYTISSSLTPDEQDIEVEVYDEVNEVSIDTNSFSLYTADPDCRGPRDHDGQCSCYAKQGKDDR